jgi:hypothetical protein
MVVAGGGETDEEMLSAIGTITYYSANCISYYFHAD